MGSFFYSAPYSTHTGYGATRYYRVSGCQIFSSFTNMDTFVKCWLTICTKYLHPFRTVRIVPCKILQLPSILQLCRCCQNWLMPRTAQNSIVQNWSTLTNLRLSRKREKRTMLKMHCIWIPQNWSTLTNSVVVWMMWKTTTDSNGSKPTT